MLAEKWASHPTPTTFPHMVKFEGSRSYTPQSQGVISLYAQKLRARRNLTHSIKTREAKIDELISEMYDQYYSIPGWDGYDAKPLDKQSISFASQFLKSLPSNITLPDLDPNPSGLLGMYWVRNGYQLLADINPVGIISYAFRSNSGLTYTGRPSFFVTAPKRLADLLNDYFKSEW